MSRDGSRTALVVQIAEQRDASAATASASLPDLAVGLAPAGTLHLRGAPRNGPRVAWDEHVVDNEGLGRKKSKSALNRSMRLEDICNSCCFFFFAVCCIFHRQRRFDESSDEDSSDSESGSDDGMAKPSGHCHRHRHRGEGEGDRCGEPEDKRQGGRDDRNAYERMSPRKGKGKSS